MLKIITHAGHQLDLYANTILSVEENSPIFTDQGSASTPLLLPPTPGNLQALSMPNRFQRRNRFTKTIRVSVSTGVYHRVASLHVESVITKGDISVVLYFRESNFYQKIKNKPLQELFEDEVRTSSNWTTHCSRVMCGDIVDDFHIFPVILSIKEREETMDEGSLGKATSHWREFAIANRPVYFPDGSGSLSTDKQGNKYYELASRMILHDDNGVAYYPPDGYGIAPYLKVTYILRTLFSKIGYTLASSDLDTDPSFQRLCLVHPVVDALVTSELRYAQLLPDVEINDFLRMLENSFGIRFLVDEALMVVNPVFFRHLLLQSPQADFTDLVQDFGQIIYAGNRNIKLTAIHETAESQPLEFETMQQMTRKHGGYQGYFQNDLQFDVAVLNNWASPGLYLIQQTRHFKWVRKINGVLTSGDADFYLQDYYPAGSELPLEHRELGFALLPLKNAPLSGVTQKQIEFEAGQIIVDFEDILQDYYEQTFAPDTGLVVQLPFLGQLQHLNTVLKTETTANGVTETSYTEEADLQPPMYLAFAHGRALYSGNDPNITRTYFASQDAYSNTGTQIGTFDLLPFSLYNNFWKQYDKLLETSFHDFTAQVHLSTAQLMGLHYDRPVSIDGQTALPLSVRYELSDAGAEVVELTLRIIREYE